MTCEIRGNLPWSLAEMKDRGSLKGAVSTIFRLENSRRIVMAPNTMFVLPRPATTVCRSIWAIAVEVVEKQLQENGRKSGDTYRWMIAAMIIGRL